MIEGGPVNILLRYSYVHYSPRVSGTRVSDGASIRAEQQVRKLNRDIGPGHSSEIRKEFPNKDAAREYETKLIERYRSIYGQNTLPGNKTNR